MKLVSLFLLVVYPTFAFASFGFGDWLQLLGSRKASSYSSPAVNKRSTSIKTYSWSHTLGNTSTTNSSAISIPTGAHRIRTKIKAQLCSTYAELGKSCGDTRANCCGTGAICINSQCVRYCPSSQFVSPSFFWWRHNLNFFSFF